MYMGVALAKISSCSATWRFSRCNPEHVADMPVVEPVGEETGVTVMCVTLHNYFFISNILITNDIYNKRDCLF